MTTVWDIPADNLFTHLGRNGEYWIKHKYDDGSRHLCLHGAIRMCDLQPGDAYVIELVADSQGWGPTWNDAYATQWTDIVKRITDGIVITDDMLADTFGPNWASILQLVRNIATVTRQQARDAAYLDDGRYDEPSRLLEEWHDNERFDMCRTHRLPLFDWTVPAADCVHHVASVAFLGYGQMQVAFARIAEVLACRHLILKDGHQMRYLTMTVQASDLFGPLHPDDPS
jgi:hypothetical protein